MDWFSAWDPGPYIEIEPAVDAAVDPGRLTAWLIVTVVALIVAALWYRQRVSRHSFCCATVGRDVEVFFRFGRVLLGIRGSHGDFMRPALPRSQLSRAVATSAAGGNAAPGAARLARGSLRLILVNGPTRSAHAHRSRESREARRGPGRAYETAGAHATHRALPIG